VCLQGTDVDACYDTAYWQSFLERYPSSGTLDSTYDVRYYRSLRRQQVEALLSDMCGWRMVSKRGYIGALKGAINTTLQVCFQQCTCNNRGNCVQQQWHACRCSRQLRLCFPSGSLTSQLQATGQLQLHAVSVAARSNACTAHTRTVAPSIPVYKTIHDHVSITIQCCNNLRCRTVSRQAWHSLATIMCHNTQCRLCFCCVVQSMVPPMLLPWSGPPTEQQFKDFWGPRGACEHFSNGASGR
jgi:hypothetical protein